MSCKSKDLTFIHIPKNAGESVKAWLQNNIGIDNKTKKHATLIETKQAFTVNKYFAIVRNPYDRIVSLFLYRKNWVERQKTKNRYSKSELDSLYGFLNKGFEYFVLNQNLIDLQLKHMYISQDDFIDNNIAFLLRYENLEKDFKTIQTYYNCYEPLPKINMDISHDYKDYHTLKTKRWVETYFKKDLLRFEYNYA